MTCPKYKYRIKNMRESSSKYGVCEVCGRWCDSVYLQSESVSYTTTQGAEHEWSHRETLFGHQECLKSKRSCPYLVEKKA